MAASVDAPSSSPRHAPKRAHARNASSGSSAASRAVADAFWGSPPRKPTPERSQSHQVSSLTESEAMNGGASDVFSDVARKTRNRSYTQSTIASTFLTRPSTSTERSLMAAMPSSPSALSDEESHRPGTAPSTPTISQSAAFYAMLPASKSAIDLPAHVSSSPQSPYLGWKTVVRRASGRFRRSASSTSLATMEPASSLTSPTKSKERSRSVSANDVGPTMPELPPSSSSASFNGFLHRKKSNSTLRATVDKKRQQQWDSLPPSPSLSQEPSERKHRSYKLSGKAKQKFNQVPISPFHIDFNRPADEIPTALGVPDPPSNFPRSSSNSLFRPRSASSSSLPRSVSSQGALEHAHTRSISNRSPRPPSPISTGSSSSIEDRVFSSSSSSLIPPVPPLPLEHRSAKILFSHPSSLSDSVSSLAAPTPATGSVEWQAVKFPSFFNFVARPDDDEGRDEEFGSSASALDVLPQGPSARSPFVPPRNPHRELSLSHSSTSSGQDDNYVPPRRSESLMRPLECKSGRVVAEGSWPGKSQPEDKFNSFEELLSMENRTVKLTLTPADAK